MFIASTKFHGGVSSKASRIPAIFVLVFIKEIKRGVDSKIFFCYLDGMRGSVLWYQWIICGWLRQWWFYWRLMQLWGFESVQGSEMRTRGWSKNSSFGFAFLCNSKELPESKVHLCNPSDRKLLLRPFVGYNRLSDRFKFRFVLNIHDRRDLFQK